MLRVLLMRLENMAEIVIRFKEELSLEDMIRVCVAFKDQLNISGGFNNYMSRVQEIVVR
jgi:hypothetical protein